MNQRKALRDDASKELAKGDDWQCLDVMPSTILELLDQIDDLRRCVEFYANEHSWLITSQNQFSKIARTITKEDSESWSYQASPEDRSIVVSVGGKLAREVLQKWEGEE